MQGIHKEGEFRQLEIWTWKSYVRPPILHNSKQAETLRSFLCNIWGILEPISTRGGPPGGHNPPGRAREPRRALVGCAHPGPPPVPIFWYISHFDLEKNKERTFRTELRLLEAELGQEHFCPPAERFRRGNFPPGGGNHRHHHHQQLSHLGEGNLHQHLQQHHLISNPSSSLVFNLVTGTIDWCLWVTSSVDYIL